MSTIHIDKVNSVRAYKFPWIGGDKVIIEADGEVNTAGWSGFRLSQRFSPTPPSDGMWEFDFIGDPPSDYVIQVQLRALAVTIQGAPDWLKGIRVYADNGSVETTTIPKSIVEVRALKTPDMQYTTNAIVQYNLATFDDSFQPIGSCGWLSIKMKKLRHELTLTVEGPDEAKIRSCIQESIAVGLIAAIVAVYATGGGALQAALSAFVAQMEACLSGGYTIRIDDRSHWIEWCT
jgi:hypothetical protein